MAIQAQLHSDNLGFPLCGTGGSQDLVMDNGNNLFGFNESCFLQQKQQYQRQSFQQVQNQTQQMNHDMFFGSNFSFPSGLKNSVASNHPSVSYSQSLMAQMDTQRKELDQCIRIQNERLRLVLQEQRKQQLALFLKNIESKATALLKQKDTEIAQATKKAMELQEILRKLEMERHEWQRVAQENEAMVISLNNTLEELREKGCCSSNNGAEDAESCCEVNDGEDREAGAVMADRRLSLASEQSTKRKTMMMTTTTKMTVCKSCNSGGSCVLFLPCRHLCCCKACEPFLDSCPVCGTLKETSVEALIF